MILILGGTSEGYGFAKLLKDHKIPYEMSVATAAGIEVAEKEGTKAFMARFTLPILKGYLEDMAVDYICDLTHPHAAEISQTAMDAAAITGVPYVRFERAMAPPPETREDPCGDGQKVPPSTNPNPNVYYVDSMEAACHLATDPRFGTTVLVTGSKHIFTCEHLLTRLAKKRVVYRVLPRVEVMQEFEKANVGMDRIVAMKGPFTQGMNEAIFDQYGIELLISKEAGSPSGTQERMDAAAGGGLAHIVIRRPRLVYPQEVDTLEDLLKIVL